MEIPNFKKNSLPMKLLCERVEKFKLKRVPIVCGRV